MYRADSRTIPVSVAGIRQTCTAHGWAAADHQCDLRRQLAVGQLIVTVLIESEKFFGGKSKIQGTRSYMAPEQIRGETLSASADIYSFGCMMYELLTGKPPFVGSNSNELLQRHLKSPPLGLDAVDKNFTPEITNLVAEMLAKKPEKRPESMQKCILALRSLRLHRRDPKK